MVDALVGGVQALVDATATVDAQISGVQVLVDATATVDAQISGVQVLVDATVDPPETTILYVRKTGSDENDGLTAESALLTLGQAAFMATPNTTIWIGAGTYREMVVLVSSGTLQYPIYWRADVDGAQTGDIGLVIVTSRTSEAYAGAGTDPTLVFSGIKHNHFHDIIFAMAGQQDSVIRAENVDCNYEGMLWDGCLIHGSTYRSYMIFIEYQTPSAMSSDAVGPTFRNCVLTSGIEVAYTEPEADVACGVVIENCVIHGVMHGSSYGFYYDGPISGSYGITGFKFNNNTFLSPVNNGLQMLNMWNTGKTGEAYSNLVLSDKWFLIGALDGGEWDSDWNVALDIVWHSNGPFTNGANNVSRVKGLIGYQIDHLMRRFFGFNPWGPFELVSIPGMYEAAQIDYGSETYKSALDIYGRQAPFGRGYDPGAVGAGLHGQRETTVKDGKPGASIRLEGAQQQVFLLPVTAAEMTVTVKARRDSNYTGDAPALRVDFIPGVADQSGAMVGAADTWEELSVTFTPTAAGIARIVLCSFDTSETGICYFYRLGVE